MKKLAPLECGCCYHVFNRTNNREPLFRIDDNKRYFLSLLEKRLAGFVNIYSYALLRNHFHLSISIKEEEEINLTIDQIHKDERSVVMKNFLEQSAGEVSTHDLIATQFSRIFNSYTQAFNKMFTRTGNLFNRPFKRLLIKNEVQFGFNQYYIHHNARKHGLIENFLDDPWHSYHHLVSTEDTFLDREFIFDWFGGKEAFIDFHQQSYLDSDFKGVYLE